jgi:hypothetical protein
MSELEEYMMEPDGPPDRREFLKCACTVACGGAAMLAPVGAATLVYLDPLFKKSGEKPFLKIANLDTLPVDGTPRKFSIVTSKQDAWNKYSAAPVGAIFLRRISENEVVALNAKCPHTGCQVMPARQRRVSSAAVTTVRLRLTVQLMILPARPRAAWTSLKSKSETHPKYGCSFKILRPATKSRSPWYEVSDQLARPPYGSPEVHPGSAL